MSDKQYGFKFVVENCIQCHGCEVACKNWREVELGVKWRRVANIWEGAYPKVTCRSASVSCMHCVEPACMEACPEEAITKRTEDGIVGVNREKCIGCKACLDACPFGVPQFGEDETMQKCDMCVDDHTSDSEAPPCVATCPTEALTLVMMDAAEKQAAENAMMNLVDAATADVAAFSSKGEVK
jgi:anaerobic dimethyl sulfoxide reductase subunit B (iron-sulfur subunit)